MTRLLRLGRILIGSCSSGLYNTHEKEFYPPFVKATNTALLFLQELEVEHLPGGNDLTCFHVLDPSRLKQEHKTSTSERKPDVMVGSETNFRNPEGGFLLDVTAKPLETPFEWRDVRTFVEFKRTTQVKMDSSSPPKSYIYQSYTAPTTEYLGLEGQESDQVSALSATPATSSANPQLALKPGEYSHNTLTSQQSFNLGPCSRQLDNAIATDSCDRKRTAYEQLTPS